AMPSDTNPQQWGEVPEASPSVYFQCNRMLDKMDPRDVDLVLVNGGINDVSPFHVVVANPFDPDGAERLEQTTRDVFLGPVQRLLVQTLARFPKAVVVVLGYYPVVSESSKAGGLVRLM